MPLPVTGSFRHLLIVVGIAVLLASLLLAALLTLYGEGLSPVEAYIDALVFILIMSLSGILSGLSLAFIWGWQAQLVIGSASLLISSCVCFAAVSLFGFESGELFSQLLPLRLTVGLSGWGLLMEYYRLRHEREEKPPVKEPFNFPTTYTAEAAAERIDRISVKDNGRIHILPVDQIIYIQACGDYATIFTPGGQFVKEHSMKYFETALPQADFIRIHRSTIVNTNHILRIELHEKNTYNVRLKSGVNLRASLAGYRLLKEKLGL
ncbi:MAG: LytTR family transcriptional regulator DNA-binding domain-containing protein [Tannerellaceae bacterium]|jgi:hypothetical protein|nr:LytTR family transcriptional regulator DNA-binding domain-containing protein [Tannerellaceae bacterium]